MAKAHHTIFPCALKKGLNIMKDFKSIYLCSSRNLSAYFSAQSTRFQFNISRKSLMLSFVILSILFIGFSFAQVDQNTANQALSPIQQGLCVFIKAISSIIVYVLVFGALVVGGLLRIAGNEAGMRIIQGAIVGALIVLVAPAAAGVFFPGGTQCT